jgi:hypothetical protein
MTGNLTDRYIVRQSDLVRLRVAVRKGVIAQV